MVVELNGTITKIFPIEKNKEYEFQRVQMQIDQQSQYPQTVEFQANSKTFPVVAKYSEGDIITAVCNVRGNQWKDKCFVSFNLWKIEGEQPSQPVSKPSNQQFTPPNDDSSGLPF